MVTSITTSISRRCSLAVLVAVAIYLPSNAQMANFQVLPPQPGPDNGPPIREIVLINNGPLGGFAGFATIYNGAPIILYASNWLQWMGGLGSPAFRFTRAHEYGHHRGQHAMQQMTTFPPLLPMLGYQQELEADCFAVKILKSNGDQQAIDAGFSVYQQVLTPGPANGRPGWVERHNTMNLCLAN